MALRRAVAAHRAAEESPGTLPTAETAAGRKSRGGEAGGRGAAPTAAALPDSIAATARRDGPAADPAAALPSGRSAPPAAADGIGPGKPAAGAPPPRVKRKKAYRQRRQERQATKKRARADAAATAAGGPRDELLFFDEVAYRPPDLTVKNRRAKTQVSPLSSMQFRTRWLTDRPRPRPRPPGAERAAAPRPDGADAGGGRRRPRRGRPWRGRGPAGPGAAGRAAAAPYRRDAPPPGPRFGRLPARRLRRLRLMMRPSS